MSLDAAHSRVYRISRALSLGPFASPPRCAALIGAGVTHLLNVGEAPSVLGADDGPFREVAWHPITDLERIPDAAALASLETLHRMICEPDAHIYVHCIAGWNRSPTVVWLYLVACGLPPAHARALVETRAPDAVAGHPKLVDTELIEIVRLFGRREFLPHPRPEALEPA